MAMPQADRATSIEISRFISFLLLNRNSQSYEFFRNNLLADREILGKARSEFRLAVSLAEFIRGADFDRSCGRLERVVVQVARVGAVPIPHRLNGPSIIMCFLLPIML